MTKYIIALTICLFIVSVYAGVLTGWVAANQSGHGQMVKLVGVE